MKVKEESEKAGLKLTFKKLKIMASGPITSWQIDGEKMENSGRFYFQWTVTAAMKLREACSLKAMTNLNSILKRRDITLPIKVHVVRAIVFPVVM